MEFLVNYTSKGVYSGDYEVGGGDVEICFTPSASFVESEEEVYVTDYLKQTT